MSVSANDESHEYRLQEERGWEREREGGKRASKEICFIGRGEA